MPHIANTAAPTQLDFWAAPESCAPAPSSLTPKTPTPAAANSLEKTPKKEATQADLAPKIPKNSTQNPWLQAMHSSLLLHPHATQRTVLQGQTVSYKLVRSPRRSVGFMIGKLGLEVRAATRISLVQIETLLQERSAWILKHLEKAQQIEADKPSPIWADGADCLLHGQNLRLSLRPELPAGAHRLHDGQLQLALPAQASAAQIERAAMDWYGPYAYTHFCQRLDHYAPGMAVRWSLLKLSSARTRWGSAKRDGSIRLHWQLVQLAPELLDYVVVHELAHLHEMNHSPRFWAIVAQHCPDYKALRAQLKHHIL